LLSAINYKRDHVGMSENSKKLIKNILTLLLAILIIGSIYGFNPKDAPLVILIGILFPFIVAVVVNIFQKNEKKGKTISIVASLLIFIAAALISNAVSPDPFILIALVLGFFVIFILGACSINIFYLIKNICFDDNN
jgi:uncharacterized membrane protein HdeD (DUF308 family)